MNAIMSILRSPKHKTIIACVWKGLLISISLILLITVDNVIANRISKNLHPTLGIVFGVGIAAWLGFFLVFPSLKKIRTMKTTGMKKNLWISGKTLTILGCTVILLHDPIVLIDVLPLEMIRVSFSIGGVLLLIGCILLLLEDYVKDDRICG